MLPPLEPTPQTAPPCRANVCCTSRHFSALSFMFSWEEREGRRDPSAVVNIRVFTWRGFGFFVFLRGVFGCVLQGLCFPIRQHAQRLTTPPFGQTAQETQWRLIKRHERHSFGDNSAYPVCFSFKQAICLYTGWIAGLEGRLSMRILLMRAWSGPAQPLCLCHCRTGGRCPPNPSRCFSCSERHDLQDDLMVWLFSGVA